MILKRLYCIVTLCLGLGLALPMQMLAQKATEKIVKYTVQPGETILGIAHRHNTTLDHLLSLNPGVQPNYVQANQVINVPYVPGGATPPPSAAQRAAANTAKATPVSTTPAVVSTPSKVTYTQLNTQQPQPKVTYKDYVAKRKDTLYGIAKQFGITVDELVEANPILKGEDGKLKKGTKLRVPVKEKTAQPKFKGLSTIRVAVILPMVGERLENERSVEFYRGMLMGINELKRAGINIVLSAFDEPEPDKSVAQTLMQVMLQNPDVIVGPLYPTHFTDVTAVSGKQTKVVVPFSSRVPQVDYRPDVFMLNTPLSYEQSLAVDLFINNFKKQTHVVLLHSENGTKRSFSEELQRRLSIAGYDVTSLPLSASAQQIASMLMGKKRGDYVLVPDDDSEATMRQMLQKSEALQQSLPDAKVSLLGYARWLPYTESADRKLIHAADTYILTPNYYYPYTTASKAFHDEYVNAFHAEFVNSNPRMAPLGYDFARGFMGSMANYGYDFNTQSPKAGTVAAQPKLQSEPRFITVGGNGGYVSRSMWLVRFKKDMSIVKISAQ